MIEYIRIQGYKSLKDVYLNGMDNIQSFIGKNGSGKTNFLNAIKYFFDNLIEDNYSEDYYDQNNPYNCEMKIEMRFNLSKLIDPNARRSNSQYRVKVQSALSGLNEKDSITVILSQNSRKGIKWNLGYEFRYLIHNSHPFYFISTHETDFQKWDSIWDIIGSLGNLFDYEEKTNFHQVFTGKTAEKFEKNVKYLESVFESAGYSLQKESNQSQLSTLYQLALRGSKVDRHGFELKYFSSGTNSLHYLKLLVQLVQKLGIEKLKSPIVIIDELELGLHAQYIDELNDLLFLTEGIQFFVTTHSARYLSEAMRQEESVYKFHMKDEYSELIKIPKLKDSRSRIIFSESEASLYFANFILFVEGPSELEVFNNPHIRDLFPVLKKVEVSQALTNKVLLKTLNPIKMKLPIPYLVVVDIDKVLGNRNHEPKNDDEKKLFKVLIKRDEEFSPLNSDFEDFINKRFYKNRWILDIIKKRILIYDKENFPVDLESGIIKDPRIEYEQMIRNLKDYYEKFKVHLLFPTLEAALINRETMEDFIHIFDVKLPNEELTEIELLYQLRQSVGGNSENLKRSKDLMVDIRFQKTGGWITDFLDAIFNEINKIENVETRRNRFNEKFPDIYGIINMISRMI